MSFMNSLAPSVIGNISGKPVDLNVNAIATIWTTFAIIVFIVELLPMPPLQGINPDLILFASGLHFRMTTRDEYMRLSLFKF